MDELESNIHGIIRSEVNYVNLLSDMRRPAIEACRSQSTNWFLILIPGRDDFKDGNLFLNVETLANPINPWRYFCKNIQISKEFIYFL